MYPRRNGADTTLGIETKISTLTFKSIRYSKMLFNSENEHHFQKYLTVLLCCQSQQYLKDFINFQPLHLLCAYQEPERIELNLTRSGLVRLTSRVFYERKLV